jgi:hypothetical protein
MNQRVSLAARIAAGVLLVVLATVVGAGSVLASRSPETALAFWPVSAEARAELSAQLLSDNPVAPDAPRVRALAAAALAREPVESTAAVSLAVAATTAGQQAAGTRAYEYAERLSRRNSGAQLLLIEERVTQNDIPRALIHYDRALRVSPRAGDVLLPVLVNAAANPPVAEALAPLLARRPPWWTSFFDRLTADGAPAAVAGVARAAQLDPEVPAERARLSAAMQRLAQTGEFATAYALYRQVRPAGEGEPLVSGGSFEEEPVLYPFDWYLASEADLAAVREPREGAAGRFALSLISDGGGAGEFASQLLRLPPGSYRLSARAGAVEGEPQGRPRLVARCADSQALAGELVFPEAPDSGRRFSGEIVVPSGCPYVWLGISSPPGFGVVSSDTPWIDDLALVQG